MTRDGTVSERQMAVVADVAGPVADVAAGAVGESVDRLLADLDGEARVGASAVLSARSLRGSDDPAMGVLAA